MSLRRLLTALALAAALGCVPLAGIAAAADAPAATPGGVSVDRVARDARIQESSGLVASGLHPGVLWTHDDSGNAPLLFALARGGATAGTVRLRGVPDVDWEALAPVTGPGGTSLLAVGDIGDNDAVRHRIEIDLVAEPRQLGSTTERPYRVLRLRYPDGPHDAETLLADPRTGRLYIVTKGVFTATVYLVPASAWPSGAGTGSVADAVLQRVGQVSLSLVTDGAVLPDGRVLLRTYSTLAVLPALPVTPPAQGMRLEPLATVALPSQQQGEGLTVLDAGTGVIALSSEGIRQPILKVVLPAAFRQAGRPAGRRASATSPAVPGSAPATSGGSSRASPSGGSGHPSGASGSGGAPAWLTGFGLLVLIVLAGAVIGLNRRR